MDIIKVVIENWPKANHVLEFIPIIIAIVALAVSLYSVHLTRKSFIASHRPYVWAASYVFKDIEKNTLIPIPQNLAYRIHNSPARIIKSEFRISLNKEILLVQTDDNYMRFPDQSSEWFFSVGKEDFEEIMNRSDEDKSKLVRFASLKYSLLGGGKTYHYELQQSFNPTLNQWRDINEKSD